MQCIQHKISFIHKTKVLQYYIISRIESFKFSHYGQRHLRVQVFFLMKPEPKDRTMIGRCSTSDLYFQLQLYFFIGLRINFLKVNIDEINSKPDILLAKGLGECLQHIFTNVGLLPFPQPNLLHCSLNSASQLLCDKFADIFTAPVIS